MFVLGNLLLALSKLVGVVLTMMYWVIIVRALISWVNPDPFHPFVQLLERITEPVLEPIRRLLPMMRIDLSPIIAILLIVFLQSFLVVTLFDLGVRLKY